MQELLKFKMRYSRPYVLLRCWCAGQAAGDTWEPLDNLTNCEAAITESPPSSRRPATVPRPTPPQPPLAGAAGAPPPISLAAAPISLAAAPPGDLGAALVGRTVLYWFPADLGRRRGLGGHNT